MYSVQYRVCSLIKLIMIFLYLCLIKHSEFVIQCKGHIALYCIFFYRTVIFLAYSVLYSANFNLYQYICTSVSVFFSQFLKLWYSIFYLLCLGHGLLFIDSRGRTTFANFSYV